MIFPPAVSGAGYEIEKSLRFRASASAYLTRSFGTPTVAGKATISFWAKRGALSQGTFFGTAGGNASNYLFIGPGSNNQLCFICVSSGVAILNKQSSALLRDPSAHYHIFVMGDVTAANSADRARMYVNGVEITSFSSNIVWPQNAANNFWNDVATRTYEIGRNGSGSGGQYDGYLSEIHFIDGQALDPTSFGEFDANGVWVPKAYTGTYGTNGFYLPFSNGTSLSTLTADASGNGNNWTASNISLTAGVNYDWMDDTPTNNFAVLNPTNAGMASTIFNANLSFAGVANTNQGYVGSTVGVTSGKFYFELTGSSYSGQAEVGVSVGGSITAGYRSNGTKDVDGVNSAYGASYTASDVIGCAFDVGTKTVEFFKNNISQGSFSWVTSGDAFPTFWARGTATHNGHLNFGQRPFAYTPPTGFKALCTANLPAPAIAKPSNHFDVKLYVGNASTQSVTGLNFQPDLVWMKSRGRAVDHAWYDSVRGVQKQLESNNTGAETTETTGLTSFNADGWTMGALDQINNTTATNAYVGWAWKASGAAVSNTDGSITSQVSANTTAGFSIVTYTGTGANATVGHGLGVAPKMVIVKRRDAAPYSWIVWHSALAGTEYLILESTNAKASLANVWNSTVPSSTVISLGSNVTPNSASGTYVAYCFAEVPGFSKIGSYTGNGNADGPFVYCGFRPAFVLVKMSSSTGDWTIVDHLREGYNVVNDPLYPNLANAEGTTALVDLTSNGFKIRSTDASVNTSGGTYIFIAFAETPFKYSRAR